ncbi:hypothetical protein ACFL6S_08435 [Candidatus Poribacteria bacterium]
MTTINMIVRTQMINAKYAEESLAASIYRVGDASKSSDYLIMDVNVPVNYSYNVSGNLEPGDHFVQLLTPWGESITEDFVVSAGEPVNIDIDLPYRSPHEWLRWHSYSGGLARPMPESRRADSPSATQVLHYDSHNVNLCQGYSVGVLRILPETTSASCLQAEAIDRVSDLISANSPESVVMDSLGDIRQAPGPFRDAEDYMLFSLFNDGFISSFAGLPEYYFERERKEPRIYVVQWSAGVVTLTPLPSPWMTRCEQSEVQLAVGKHITSQSREFSLTIGEPLMMSVFGYMTIGAGSRAARLLNYEQAERMLYTKMMNPYAAAAGGYLLLLSNEQKAHPDESKSWKIWIRNLENWFPWLPDGAILRAALYFNLGDGRRETAREALFEAYSRGLPYYTMGLKLMIDGMRSLAYQGDSEAEELLEKLKIIARKAHPSQIFLSIDLTSGRTSI